MILSLAIKSLRNRRFTALLTIVSIALAVALLLAVEHLRAQSRDAFARSVAGTDLIVGARTSPVNLLLASVFRIGNATNNLSDASRRRVAAQPEVAWTIPISLGDSHRGFRVIGTTQDYFTRLRYGSDRSLQLTAGRRFTGDSEAVLGADVAEALHYHVDQSIVIAHGSGDVEFTLHRDHPFRIVGVLARTGTPVDRAIHVSLEGLDAAHEKVLDDPLAAALSAARSRAHDADHDDSARAVTAIFVGLKSRSAALAVQRRIDEFTGEPLTAILPGVTLLEVWELAAVAERTLLAVSVLVVLMGLASMLIALLTSLGERRREMAVLRALGARPWQVFALILGEAAFLTWSGIVFGIAALGVGLVVGGPWIERHAGLVIALTSPSAAEVGITALVAVAGVLIGLIPAYRIYRQSLADGMTVRI